MLYYGFTQSHAGHSLFTFQASTHFIVLLVYVDDIKVAGDHLQSILDLKIFLDQKFKIKDLSDLLFFLSLEVARSKKEIVLNQRKYAFDILEESDFLASKPLSFPMQQNIELSKDDSSLLSDASLYHRLIG